MRPSVRNAVEKARLRHANRFFDLEIEGTTKDDLMRLEPDDFLASRVCSQPEDVDERRLRR